MKLSASLAAVSFAACSLFAAAQVVPHRLSQAAPFTSPVALAGTVSHRLATAQHLGHLAGDTQLTHMTLALQPTDAQEAALTQLLHDQQDPASASYHHWLTPSQFGGQFGVSDDDLAIVKNWLTSRGFTVEDVTASRNAIHFTGTAATVESAFGTSLQTYTRNGQTFFDNGTELNVPAALAGIVRGVTGLSSYRVMPPQATKVQRAASPQLTSNNSHFLVPWDFRQIYGMNTLTGAGFDGTGVKIVVVGQSAIDTTQISNFQTLTGQTQKLPTIILVPTTGTSTAVSGDEGESEVDIEYTGGSAPGAAIQFVYTGNSKNNGVFDSLAYAVNNALAPIISVSYGACEADVSASISSLEAILRQANGQGQTVIVSSGDQGAATCDADQGSSGKFTTASAGLTVSYPASSAYVTALGGTQLSDGAGTYWSTSNNGFGGSALGYIPEVAWNDSANYPTASPNYVSATGGGASKLFGKPSWQTGNGVPADGHRDLPDVSFPSSAAHDGYLVCSAEAANESCTATKFSQVAFGGTSLAAPNFAAMMAIIEQANGKTGGLGNINPSLYQLAAGSSASTIFHDITSGNNMVPCTGGSANCSSTVVGTNGTVGYTAVVGYDLVTGIGSVNAPALQAALKATVTTLPTPTVSLSASPSAPTLNQAVTFTSSVAGTAGTATGTIIFAVDGATIGSPVTLVSGTATYAYSGFTVAGGHTVTATYSGSTAYATASASLSITAAVTGSFTIVASPTPQTVTAGTTASETITVTPVNGFTGAVGFTASLISGSGTFHGCYVLPATTVAAGSAATSTMTIYTSNASPCAAGSAVPLNFTGAVAANAAPATGLGRTGWVMLSATLFGIFSLRRRIRYADALLAALLSVALMLGVAGCGSGGTSAATTTTTTTVTNAGAGTYTLQVNATASANTSIGASSQFVLIIR